MKKSHSLKESERKSAGEPVDEPDRSFKTKVGITAHQVPSVYHPARPGPFCALSPPGWGPGTAAHATPARRAPGPPTPAVRTSCRWLWPMMGCGRARGRCMGCSRGRARGRGRWAVRGSGAVPGCRDCHPPDHQHLGVDQAPGSGPLVQDPKKARGRHRPDYLAPVEELAVVPRFNLVPHRQLPTRCHLLRNVYSHGLFLPQIRMHPSVVPSSGSSLHPRGFAGVSGR